VSKIALTAGWGASFSARAAPLRASRAIRACHTCVCVCVCVCLCVDQRVRIFVSACVLFVCVCVVCGMWCVPSLRPSAEQAQAEWASLCGRRAQAELASFLAQRQGRHPTREH
jgi:hypothetical protein